MSGHEVLKKQSSSNVGSSGANASRALRRLIEEDPLLEKFQLTTLNPNQDGSSKKDGKVVKKGTEPVFTYAAALVNADSSLDMDMDSQHDFFDPTSGGNIQQKAKDALAEVERKLLLVGSLSERISREKPEHVAAPLLKLHGFTPFPEEQEQILDSDVYDGSAHSSETSRFAVPGLTSTLERCDRLARQSQVLDSVANRVESTLERGLARMNSATEKLDRVLKTSQVLKMVMRLQFEAKKVLGSGLDFDALLSNDDEANIYHSAHVDLRDLTRAAASVAIIEELLNHEDLKDQGIDTVEQMRPEAERVAKAVKIAAAGLLADQHGGTSGASKLPSATKLGATLQVYYHLGELPFAAWSAVSLGLDRAEKASGKFLNPSAMKRLIESAKADAKAAVDKELGSSNVDRRRRESAYNRALKMKLRDKKAEAAVTWASGVAEAALQVFNLHRVLLRKSDPVSRQNFMEVVNAAPIPDKFLEAQELANSTSKKSEGSKKQQVSIFSLFWNQMCINLGARMQRLLKYENGAIAADVATFYPAIRSASLDMLSSVQDSMQAGALSYANNMMDDVNGRGSGMSGGIMGGSVALDDPLLLGFAPTEESKDTLDVGFTAVSADQWTKKDPSAFDGGVDKISHSGRTGQAQTSAVSSILLSPEWLALQGSGDVGLYPMQRSFLQSLRERLSTPIKTLFLENTMVDENGIDMKMLPTLPSDKDLGKIEKVLKKELSIADPREGGGDFSMTTIISECIVELVEIFCSMAKGATSGATESKLINASKGTATEELLHDMKVASILSSLTSILRGLPEDTFIVPYRPAHSLQHEEAANMCEIALLPAIHEIESLVKRQFVAPLCNVLNRELSSQIALMHKGIYIGDEASSQGSFVQTYLVHKYENIASQILSRLPGDYGAMVASTICAFSIYCFVSNASLIRPLGEVGRLRITQDLADFELILEQLIFKGGGSTPLNQIFGGKPYAELRAVRQMLFWNGLEDKTLSSERVSKAFFREVWVKDVRPSTTFHFLFTFAPTLLSSPHHSCRMSAEEYVRNLVKLDGSVEDGEGKAWMTTMSCCDAYAQRESIDGGVSIGDRRIPAILMIIGPELLRRRRY